MATKTVKRDWNNLLLIAIPFLLTFGLISLGYALIINQNPEAEVNPPASETQVQLLNEADVPIIRSKTILPAHFVLVISSVPGNQTQLDQLIKLARDQSVQGVYLAISVSVSPDESLKLTNADRSSAANVERWTKKTISTLHQNNFNVLLTLSLNATTVLDDAGLFTRNLSEFVRTWSALATQLGVTYFSPGITLGHPLFSKLPDAQMNLILKSVQNAVRQDYHGKIGVGLCCTAATKIQPAGYNFLTLIPTPEFPFGTIAPVAGTISRQYKMSPTLYYLRDQQQATTTAPE